MNRKIQKNTSIRMLVGILIFVTGIALVTMNIYYSLSFSRLSRDRAEEYFQTISELVVSQITNVTRGLEEATVSIESSRTLHRYLTEEEDALQRPFVRNLLMEAILSSGTAGGANVIEGIYLVAEKPVLVTSSAVAQRLLKQMVENYKLENVDYYHPFYTSVYEDAATGALYYGYAQPIRHGAGFEAETATNLGYCVYLYNTEAIFQPILDLSLPTGAVMTLYDERQTVIASTRPEREKLPLEEELSDGYEMRQLERRGVSYLVKTTKIEPPEWCIQLLIPVRELAADMNNIRLSGFWIGALAGLIVIFLGFVIAHSISRQVKNLTRDLAKIDSYGKGYRLPNPYGREIGAMVEQTNRMLERVDLSAQVALEAQENLHENEMEKKHAQMYALQSQIYPHFLYNTLECIRGLALYRDQEQIAFIATSVGNIYRYCSSAVDFVPLSEEINCIKEYFSIINIRFKGRIRMEIDVPEDLYGRRILKMTLQPIVENAVYHGLEKVSHKGQLTVKARLQGDEFTIIVHDNGVGMSLERYETVRQDLREQDGRIDEVKIGLVNIQKRIKLTYGEAYGLSVESREREGTTVTLWMPADEPEGLPGQRMMEGENTDAEF